MTTRRIHQVIPALEVSEGAGVRVHRTLGTPALRHLDPFLMLDHFSSHDPNDYVAGFPDHPHRGFITFTYMLDGHMRHQDSMGNRGELRPGGVQWMKAASGVIHSEMPRQRAGRMRGFQLWINLPAAEKMSDPDYQEFAPDRIPLVERNDQRVRVLSGAYGGERGPIQDPHTEVIYLDVELAAGASFRHAVPPGHSAFLYPFEGALRLGSLHAAAHQLVVLGDGKDIELNADPGAARFILVAGRPIGEPIVQYGPFVMNSREEIERAFEDYRSGRLVRARAQVTG